MQNKINEFIFFLFAVGGKGYSCGYEPPSVFGGLPPYKVVFYAACKFYSSAMASGVRPVIWTINSGEMPAAFILRAFFNCACS